MSATIIDDTELVEALARAGIQSVSSEDRAEAIDRATDRVREAALNWYTADSFELLAVDTTPPEMLGHALTLAVHEVTRFDAARPASIDAQATEATKWLGYLAGGTTHYDQLQGAVLVALDSGAVVASRSTIRVFDRTDPCGDYSRRNPKI